MPIGYTAKPRGVLDRVYRWFSRVTSNRTVSPDELPSLQARSGYLKSQQLGYAAVQHVAALLKPGMSEKQAADLLEEYLKLNGTERYLHRAFAWLGEHSLA